VAVIVELGVLEGVAPIERELVAVERDDKDIVCDCVPV